MPDIIAFCEKHNIEWMPIKLDIVPKQNEDGTLAMENGEPKRVKILRPDRFGMPKPTDFAQDPQKVKQRQAAYHQNPGNYTHVAMDTREVFQIDIDCPEYADVFKKMMDEMRRVKNFHTPVVDQIVWPSHICTFVQFSTAKKSYSI